VAALSVVGVAHGAEWAVLVCGSRGWFNYRHHADVCHAYHTLISRELQPDNIITLPACKLASLPACDARWVAPGWDGAAVVEVINSRAVVSVDSDSDDDVYKDPALLRSVEAIEQEAQLRKPAVPERCPHCRYDEAATHSSVCSYCNKDKRRQPSRSPHLLQASTPCRSRCRAAAQKGRRSPCVGDDKLAPYVP
jgi:glycosylphosphatidylinositol transamidase (GPIT) subunit GPI8